ncbi:hypothetical protein L207DRAFT_514549 [Hyaloscypha variabilis F]|uniref:Uncharacterized protein n=1 Tax=Hyaloscypha variabilis (strain UAMH 11265 / GT02V1 / F) TaxID=1149755 RepID=A0A2J6RFH3_HYAVF|nr:hypothetical protein L207DRAFT_514549 [Hyaloscypha variabilis F]
MLKVFLENTPTDPDDSPYNDSSRKQNRYDKTRIGFLDESESIAGVNAGIKRYRYDEFERLVLLFGELREIERRVFHGRGTF